MYILKCQTCRGTSRLLCIFISAPVGVLDLVKVVRIRFISQEEDYNFLRYDDESVTHHIQIRTNKNEVTNKKRKKKLKIMRIQHTLTTHKRKTF